MDPDKKDVFPIEHGGFFQPNYVSYAYQRIPEDTWN